ncbi:hypothetical protein TNIN_215271 [Trichonephila inaurata madagascariensis]|uniref:Uncharacterized protein n=1 Tax=Trichonephila inaurata madagascariensis TaxID=2747483 RepID=A0A8X7C5D0_9ARAC|nr:hypothetical protein TNIN_215271 [Trichonephila inaurata madagascariensis]
MCVPYCVFIAFGDLTLPKSAALVTSRRESKKCITQFRNKAIRDTEKFELLKNDYYKITNETEYADAEPVLNSMEDDLPDFECPSLGNQIANSCAVNPGFDLVHEIPRLNGDPFPIEASQGHISSKEQIMCSSGQILQSLSGFTPKSLKTFVGNRVSQTQQLPKDFQWKHISSEFNPADALFLVDCLLELAANDLWGKGAPI